MRFFCVYVIKTSKGVVAFLLEPAICESDVLLGIYLNVRNIYNGHSMCDICKPDIYLFVWMCHTFGRGSGVAW